MHRSQHIVHGAVSPLYGYSKVLNKILEAIRLEAGYRLAAHAHRAESPPLKVVPQPLKLAPQKIEIEVDIVGHENRPLRDLDHTLSHLIKLRCIGDHLVVDARNHRNLVGDARLRIDQRLEAVDDLLAIVQYDTDLRDAVVLGTTSRRLQIHYCISLLRHSARRYTTFCFKRFVF